MNRAAKPPPNRHRECVLSYVCVCVCVARARAVSLSPVLFCTNTVEQATQKDSLLSRSAQALERVLRGMEEWYASLCVWWHICGGLTTLPVLMTGTIQPKQLEMLQKMPVDPATGLLWWQWVERHSGICEHQTPRDQPAFLTS